MAPQYWRTRAIFQRALALVYLIAFLIAANQAQALIGSHGLYPFQRYVHGLEFWDAPSLLVLVPTDSMLAGVSYTGAALATLALTGLSELGGAWLSAGVWL